LNAEDVVVDREHVHGGGRDTGGHGDSNLRVIDAREVASTGRLVLLGLEREGVRVHTGVRVTGVVVVGLDLVEVLTLLGLEAVLTVEDELEVGEGTNSLFTELDSGRVRTPFHTSAEERDTGTLADGHEGVGTMGGLGVGLKDNTGRTGGAGEVPHRGSSVRRGGVVEAPHQLLDGVVVRQALVGGLTRGDGVRTSVLHLLDQVFVTLLGESATLFGVQVDVVGPHLEHILVQVGLHVRGQIEINADLVVLEGNQRQEQTGVPVEEENQGQVHNLAILSSGHLTPVSLLGFVQVKLGVQTPPPLVVFVNALTTDGKLRGGDGTLGDPARGGTGEGVGRISVGLEFEVHVTDEITVTGDGHGHAAGVGGGTVDGLLDVLHREVSVAFVDSLEEGHFRISGQVDILGTVSDELHKTTGHFESICTIQQHFFSG
jgi:hypothetical protein